jgi:hypothetical protein
MFCASRSVFSKRVFASFLRATKKEGPRGSGAKQWLTAKGGVYAMQPQGAWRKAAPYIKKGLVLEPLDSSRPLLAVRFAPGAMFVLNDNGAYSGM